MERLREAGLNPYMAMQGSGNASGVATSAPGTGNAPTMQSPDASAFQLQSQGSPWYGLFQGLASGMMSFGQNWATMTNAHTNKDVGNSQIGLNNANTKMTLLRKDWAPRLWGSAIGLNESQTALNVTNNQFLQETTQVRKDLLSASLAGMQLSNDNQRILNYYLPAEKQLSLGLQVQQIANMVATEHLTYAQAKESVTRSILNNAQSKYYGAMTENVEEDTKMKKLDYKKASALADDYIRTALAQNSYERSLSLAGELKAELEAHKTRWHRDKYYDGPLEGVYHTLDKFKEYAPNFLFW